MSTRIGGIHVDLGLNTAQFQRGVQNAKREAAGLGASLKSSLGGIAKNFGAGLFAGIAAGGVAGIVSQIGQVANGIAQIGDEAKRAGVSAKAFQEWKFVAEQNRIGVDALTDGLKELNLRADEFVQTGKGSAAEAFQRLGYSAGDLKKKLEDPSALMLEIIDRLGKMDRAAQIRISDELFGGTGGEKFVQLIEQGEKGIRATIDEAYKLGVVMDDEVIKRAAELDKKFNAITTTVGTGLKTAIVAAATELQNFINTFQGWW
ncbi:phage tail tape measure protein, partial [Rhizobiaceae sp. 2RAB30]